MYCMKRVEDARKMQIKTTTRCHLTPVRMAVITKMKGTCWQGHGEKELLHTVGGTVNWYNHIANNF